MEIKLYSGGFITNAIRILKHNVRFKKNKTENIIPSDIYLKNEKNKAWDIKICFNFEIFLILQREVRFIYMLHS